MTIRDSWHSSKEKDAKLGSLQSFKVYQFDHTTKNGKAPLFVKPGKHFGARYRWHFRRWWWLYALILFVIIVLLVVLLIVFLAYPGMAQGRLDGAGLMLDSVELTNTNASTYHINIQAHLQSQSSYNPSLDAFDATLALQGQPAFLTVPIPAVQLTSSSQFRVNEDVTISNEDAFAVFIHNFITYENLELVTDGSTSLHDGALPSQNVNFEKSNSISGLNSLKGMTMQNVNILSTPDARSNNFFAELHINNPSQLTVDFGNATFDNYFVNSPFGWSYVDNMVIHPGNNVLSLRAITDPDGIEQGVQKAPYCSTGVIPITLKPSFVFNQLTQIKYFQEALHPLNLTFMVDVGQAVGRVLNKTITC